MPSASSAPDPSRRKLQMDAQEIRLTEQLFLRDVRGAAGLRLFVGQIFAPGDQVHADRLADRADLAAELAEAEEAERLAGQLDPERRLPRHALLHARVLVADL